jgi:peptidoglycan hydrolase-like amidase
MIAREPKIDVGVLECRPEVRGRFDGRFTVDGNRELDSAFAAHVEGGSIVLTGGPGGDVIRQREVRCVPAQGATFTLDDVKIGIRFHWERTETQTFQGNLKLVPDENETVTVVNEVSLEDYLASVISSEMSAKAPAELLRAHAITSRSWLVAMLERKQATQHLGRCPPRTASRPDEFVRWYDREDHALFDVCADDHCQRYQGITKIISSEVAAAIHATRGLFLLHNGSICDARFHKACGGLTDRFENTWQDLSIPYLQCVSDAAHTYQAIRTEAGAERWILGRPAVYCNTTDGAVLRQVLPSFDQETTDFFRWSVDYSREELEEMIKAASGSDFGTLLDLVPVQRGPSGRIVKLTIKGTAKTLVVGKELEIRRWLSKSHLYSSAFVVHVERDDRAVPIRFTLHGAGWGHGVGLCQIGAAVMSAQGFDATTIVRHYFPGTEVRRLY